MDTSTLAELSNQWADLVDAVAPSVVQVNGRRRPATGVVFASDLVLTTMRAIGGEDGLRVRTHDNRALDAHLAGWDPSTGLALLQAPNLNGTPLTPAAVLPRTGHLVMAVARSWSNIVTASTGSVAIVGGPLRTGRRRAIEQVIRVTVPMHDGFAGAPLIGTDGCAIGVATAAAIRGFGVVVPAGIAWRATSDIQKIGRPRRGFLGIAAQSVRLPERQRRSEDGEAALVVVGVTPGSPADGAGLRVGDVLVALDDHRLESAEQLLDFLTADRIGRSVTLTLLRGEAEQKVTVTLGEREVSA